MQKCLVFCDDISYLEKMFSRMKHVLNFSILDKAELKKKIRNRLQYWNKNANTKPRYWTSRAL
jgi:hypothetical protein